MKIIAECGATKGDWRLIDDTGEIAQEQTCGINVSNMQTAAIKEIIDTISSRFHGLAPEVTDIHIYVAGVMTEDIRTMVTGILSEKFPAAEMEFQHDLTAAARAACGHNPGIAAIVGTGSNSCLWDGEKITARSCSGGFILGDEGSAAVLGKLFISDFLKGIVPDEIAKDFASRYQSDYETIISNVYRSASSPSAYLGSLAPFITEHFHHPYIKGLVEENFRSFIRRSLKQHDTDRYPVSVVGGFAFALKDIFSRIAAEEGIIISRFIKAPMDSLIEYHRQKPEYPVSIQDACAKTSEA